MVELGGGAHSFLGVFGSFMISRPNFGCSHWLEFVYTRMLSRRHYVHSNEPVGECQCGNVIF